MRHHGVQRSGGGGAMTSPFRKVCRFTIHMKTEGCVCRSPWDLVTKKCVFRIRVDGRAKRCKTWAFSCGRPLSPYLRSDTWGLIPEVPHLSPTPGHRGLRSVFQRQTEPGTLTDWLCDGGSQGETEQLSSFMIFEVSCSNELKYLITHIVYWMLFSVNRY